MQCDNNLSCPLQQGSAALRTTAAWSCCRTQQSASCLSSCCEVCARKATTSEVVRAWLELTHPSAGVVLFPGAQVPVQLRDGPQAGYARQLQSLLLKPGPHSRLLVVVSLADTASRHARQVHGSVLSRVGCVAEMQQLQHHRDGRLTCIAVGGWRLCALITAAPGSL